MNDFDESSIKKYIKAEEIDSIVKFALELMRNYQLEKDMRCAKHIWRIVRRGVE